MGVEIHPYYSINSGIKYNIWDTSGNLQHGGFDEKDWKCTNTFIIFTNDIPLTNNDLSFQQIYQKIVNYITYNHLNANVYHVHNGNVQMIRNILV